MTVTATVATQGASPSSGGRRLTLGLLGGGVVGGGCVEILKTHDDIKIKTIVVKDLSKPRDFTTKGIRFTDNPQELVDDPEIDIIVDVMGGVDQAWQILEQSLKKGKHVVSANKACLATMLPQIDDLFTASRSSMLFFEAAVAGGVPIINVVRRSLTTDEILRIGGILNGTTNYILSAMDQDGKGYAEVLKDAQRLGYAESDPTADVMGHDARHKLILLARMAFGVSFTNDQIFTQGITDLIAEDFAYSKLLNCTIKLIAEASSSDENGKSMVRGFVGPVFVSKDSGFASCCGALNEVEVVTCNLGRISAKGPGAGRYATANSVASDIMECKALLDHVTETNEHPRYPHPFNRKTMPASQAEIDGKVPSEMFYLRLRIRDQTGIIASLATVLSRFDVSIHAIHQTPIVDPNNVTFCIITEKTSSFNMNHVINAIQDESFIFEPPFFCPFRGLETHL